MEPFQLLCPGCASKLKVRNRSAIGQRLACPKCRQMILVEVPEGLDVGESKIESASFDDMDLDALLENRPPVSAKKPVQVSINAPHPKRPTTTTPRPPQTPNQELAPGEEWVNPATKKKQQLVFLIMAGIGSLLAIGALSVYLLGGFGSAGDDVAAVVPDDNKEAIHTDSGKKPEVIAEPVIDVDPEIVEPEIAEPEAQTEPDPVAGPDIGDAPSIMGVPETPPGILGTAPEIALPSEGFGDEATTNKAVAETNPATPRNERDQVNSMLAESGTSLLEIQSAASVARNDFAIGTPKYFFEKIDFEPTDSNRAKDQVLLGVKYDQQPLQTVLHELSAISGLQLTIDVPSIATAGADFNPKVSLQVENESTGSVVRKVAQSVGLTAIETDRGFWITVESKDEFEQQDISVALVIENQEDGLELVQLVTQLIYPGTWETDPKGPDADPNQPKGKIAFAEGKLQLKHLPAVIREVQKLIDGLKAAARDDASSSLMLKPIPWIDADSFAKQLEPMNAVRETIGKFFRGLKDNHDVKVLADWHSLANTGWTSDAMAPGRIEERTVGDVVRETAHGMGAAFYVVDDETVWITAPQVANNIFLLKLYPVGKLADGRMTKQRLAHVLSSSLGSQMAQPGVAFFVLPRQKLVVVRAPQSLHRQLSAVFSAIK